MKSAATRLIAGLIGLAPLMVAAFPAVAQSPAPPLQASGPIDIQANEQEFAGSEVIAKGNVRVKYKDSVVLAPQARLLKDGTGNPQKAVFTGHPHLTQGNNKMDADTIIFEVANSKVVADGNAHSEVLDNNGSDDSKKLTPTAKSSAKTMDGAWTFENVNNLAVTPTATSAPGSTATKPEGKEGGAWPFAPGQKPATGSTAAPAPKSSSAAASGSDSGSTASASAGTAATGSASPAPSPKPSSGSAAAGVKSDKIITDSDHQEYDRSSGKFFALGHVRVLNGDIYVKADKLDLIYGLDNKPETCRFSGHVSATQDKNTTLSDSMIYSLSTRRLQATGHVKSTVIQENKQQPAVKKTASADPLGMPAAGAAEKKQPGPDDVLTITSETQDYSRDTNRMSANGNVHFYYQDMTGSGPACIMIRNSINKPERIIFSGRSQISQPDKRWIADRIEMVIADKKVFATGNTKAIILKAPKAQPEAPSGPNTQLADPEKVHTL